MYHLKHQKYKIKLTEMEYLNNVQKYRIIKRKNILLVLEGGLRELNDSKLKDRNKNYKIIFLLIYIFTKLITIPAANREKFEKEEMTKKRP